MWFEMSAVLQTITVGDWNFAPVPIFPGDVAKVAAGLAPKSENGAAIPLEFITGQNCTSVTSSAVQAMWAALSELTKPDIGPDPPPRWYAMLTVQMAHAFMGTMLALFRAPMVWVWAVFGLWVAKEVFGDIPNGGGVRLVLADSLADLTCAALGYVYAYSRMEKHHHDKG